MSSIWNERGDITTDYTDSERITGKYDERSAHKFGNSDKRDKLLEIHRSLKLS